MFRKALCLFLSLLGLGKLSGQSLPFDSLMGLPIHTSLEAALQDSGKVYRLHLKGLRMDSLPEELFKLEYLQELSVTHCRLLVLNRNIHQLKHLQRLILYKNRLVRLPDELCELHNLRYLDINRNLIDILPENMGLLSQLEELNAWGNYFFVLPSSMTRLAGTLKKLDLRQIQFRRSEIETIEGQLPRTEILYTDICDCKTGRGG